MTDLRIMAGEGGSLAPGRWGAGPAAPSGDRARKTVVVYLCLAMFFLSAFGGVSDGYIGVAILTAALLIGLPNAGQSSLTATMVITGVAIFTMPYIGLIYVDAGVQTAWFALFIVVAMALVAAAEPPARAAGTPGYGIADLPLIAVYLVAGLYLWGGEGISQIAFYAGWALALVHLERIHARTRSLPHRALGLALFALVIGYFVAVLWSGGGRIVQLSFSLAPILLTVHYRTFRLNGLILGGAAVALSFAGRLLRFGWSDGLAGLSVDSGASPITITSYLWLTRDSVLATGSVFEQWALLFLNWFPRELWPGKPVGVGSTFVDLVIGRVGVSQDHNLAIGFFGEHIFFLPRAWIISIVALTGVIIVLRRSVVRLSAPYRAPVIVFDVWLITLFWGGMAAFAARVWFGLVPVLLYVMFIRFLDQRSGQRPGAIDLSADHI